MCKVFVNSICDLWICSCCGSALCLRNHLRIRILLRTLLHNLRSLLRNLLCSPLRIRGGSGCGCDTLARDSAASCIRTWCRDSHG